MKSENIPDITKIIQWFTSQFYRDHHFVCLAEPIYLNIIPYWKHNNIFSVNGIKLCPKKCSFYRDAILFPLHFSNVLRPKQQFTTSKTFYYMLFIFVQCTYTQLQSVCCSCACVRVPLLEFAIVSDQGLFRLCSWWVPNVKTENVVMLAHACRLVLFFPVSFAFLLSDEVPVLTFLMS